MHSEEAAAEAAALIWSAWRAGTPLEDLPETCRPRTLAEGYRAQAALEAIADSPVQGWKIAATSAAGQRHIHVDGPLAGRLFGSQVQRSPAKVSLAGNRMLVAEAEFAFVLGKDLPPASYEMSEVLAAVSALHPAIELPDSRLERFTDAGAAQLAADNACAHHFVLGEDTGSAWQALDLSRFPVTLRVDDGPTTRGTGADVLGDPRLALTWLANCPGIQPRGLRRGDIITTGVCGAPTPIRPGAKVRADFGGLGTVQVALTD